MNKDDFAEFGGSLAVDAHKLNYDAILAPGVLHISMTRGKKCIADELSKQFGRFERVIIDVDGERHEFGADSFIRLLESYEDASRWHELFGTPERTARTLRRFCADCFCGDCATCGVPEWANYTRDYKALLEWLREANK